MIVGKYKKAGRKKGKRRWRVRTLIKKYKGVCALCGCVVTLETNAKNQASVDHVIPRSAGGSEEFSNLQLLCRECNQNKGSTIIDEDGEVAEE
jgi:5-methylcytosine-specific restriction endonuclease McrA